MKKKLCKSNKYRMIFGVCGGWAELLNWDPTIIRVLFILLSFFKGIGIFLYVVLAVIMPVSVAFDDENIKIEEDEAENKSVKSTEKKSNKKSKNTGKIHSEEDFNSFFES